MNTTNEALEGAAFSLTNNSDPTEVYNATSIADGTVKLTDDPKNLVYNRLLCPELLLWIFEASEVNPTKVRKAKEVAEAGKASGVIVATIASNMRKEVPYEDIYNNVVKYLEAK